MKNVITILLLGLANFIIAQTVIPGVGMTGSVGGTPTTVSGTTYEIQVSSLNDPTTIVSGTDIDESGNWVFWKSNKRYVVTGVSTSVGGTCTPCFSGASTVIIHVTADDAANGIPTVGSGAILINETNSNLAGFMANLSASQQQALSAYYLNNTEAKLEQADEIALSNTAPTVRDADGKQLNLDTVNNSLTIWDETGDTWVDISSPSDRLETPVNQTGHGFTVGQAIRFRGSTGLYELAIADGNGSFSGMVSEVIGVDDFKFVERGYVDFGVAHGITIDSTAKVSETVAGTIEEGLSGTTYIEPAFKAATATAGWVRPPLTFGASVGGSADNLGNHTATQPLNMNNNPITDVRGDASTPAINLQGVEKKAVLTANALGGNLLDGTSNVIFADGSSSGFTITLPAASTSTGWEYEIIRTDNTPNIVTISGTGLTKYLADKRYCKVISDGTNWILSH